MSLLALVVFGLSTQIPQVAGDTVKTIKIDGVERTFVQHLPTGYTNKKPRPLVVLLHGWTGSGRLVKLYTHFGELSDKEGFILVCPDGLKGAVGNGWNTGFLNLGSPKSNDVAFIEQVIDQEEKSLKIDQKRVFVAGHSNGAMMAYVIGSHLSEKVAAIGVVAGTIGLDRGDHIGRVEPPKRPVSAIIFHGQADPTVAYDHGQALIADDISAPESARFWAKADGIGANPKRTTSEKGNLNLDQWSGGKGGADVELYSIVNGTHDWPGGLTWEGPETKSGIKATDLIWAFFVAHPKK